MPGMFSNLIVRNEIERRRRRHARPCLLPLEERCLLSFGSPLLFNTGTTNSAVAIGDVTGNGIADLVTATKSGGINIALGNGDGTFVQDESDCRRLRRPSRP